MYYSNSTTICNGEIAVAPTPQRPIAPKVNPDGIPDELKNLKRWCCWSYECRTNKDGSGRWTKVPYQPVKVVEHCDYSGQHDEWFRKAQSNLTGTWHSFDACLAVVDHFDGLGIMLGHHVADGVTLSGIDLDKCVQNEVAEPWAEVIVTRFSSFCDLSPSDTGVKILLQAAKPDTGCRKVNPDGSAIEVYGRGRFFTITGRPYGGCTLTVAELQNELDAFCSETFGPLPSSKVERQAEGGYRISGEVNPDLGQSVAFMAEFLARYEVSIASDQPYDGGYKWRLQVCPFCDRAGSVVGVAATGGKWFKCSHNSCKDLSWADYKSLFEDAELERDEQQLNEIVQPLDVPNEPGSPELNESVPEPTHQESPPTPPKHKLLNWWQVKERMRTNPPHFIIQDILAAGDVTMVSGLAMAGKSYLLGAAVAAVGQGVDFLNYSTVPCPIVYVNADRRPYDLIGERVVHHLIDDEGEKEFAKHFVCPEIETLETPLPKNYLELLVKNVLENLQAKTAWVIVDTLRAAFLVGQEKGAENDTWMVNVMTPLQKLAKQFNVAVTVVHHHNRTNDDYAGGGIIAGCVDAFWKVRREESSDSAELSITTRRGVRTKLFVLKGPDGKLSTFAGNSQHDGDLEQLINLWPMTPSKTIAEVMAENEVFFQAKGWSLKTVQNYVAKAEKLTRHPHLERSPDTLKHGPGKPLKFFRV